MGLDMYLEVPDNSEESCEYGKRTVVQWRKANQIHAWFVKFVQDGRDDCCEYIVRKPALEVLLNRCRQVLANPEEAPNLLPTQQGCFFGPLEYDEWYFENIKDTIADLEDVLASEHKLFIYQSSW